MTQPINYTPIHQSTLTDQDWQERLRTSNPSGAVDKILAEREEAAKKKTQRG